MGPDHLAHLLEVARRGVNMSYQGPRERRQGMAYQSARDKIGEAYDQLWQEVRTGRVLVCTEDLGDLLAGVVSSPFSRVAKQNPDRTVADEGRFCHDCRIPINEGSDKRDHPRVALPTHGAVAREVLRLRARYPGVPVLVAKRDVKSAFKLIWLAPGDAPLLATDLPGDPVGLTAAVDRKSVV